MVKSKGKIHETSSAYSPESNGKAERFNRTLLDIARTMIQEIEHVAGRQKLWADDLNTANYIRNRLYSGACNYPNKTPFKVIIGRKPNVRFMGSFVSKAYVHVPKAKSKGKLDSKAELGYLISFANGNSYQVYISQKKSVIISRDVKFDEISSKTPLLPSSPGPVPMDTPTVSFDAFQENAPIDSFVNRISIPTSSEQNNDDVDGATDLQPLTHYLIASRSDRIPRPPDRYTDTSAIIALNVRMGNQDSNVPTPYKEVVSGPDNAAWRKAMEEEMSSIENNDTWILEAPQQGVNAIENRWIFTNNTDASGALTRRRARLVAKGFSQRIGIDFNTTFASVASYTTLRSLLSVIASQSLAYLQVDVKSAFLNCLLEETIFMKQPEGFVHPLKPQWVHRLHKALYGLKQASRAWHMFINKLLLNMGFRAPDQDPLVSMLQL